MQYLARLESIARWSVYLLFALVPFFFVPLSWVSVAQSKALLVTIVVTVAFLAWIGGMLNASSFRFPKSPLLVATALIPLAYLVSALATGASWGAFAGDGMGQDTVVGFVLLYIALFLCAETLGGSKSVPALRFLLLGSFVVIAVQFVHLVFPGLSFGGALAAPATSIVGSWHDLGIFLVLVVFVSLALRATPVFQGYWSPLAIIAALASLALLVVVNFSDVWLGLLGTSVFGAFFFSRALSTMLSKLRSAAPWLLCAVLALGMYFGGNIVQTKLPAFLQVTQVEVRPSWEGTFVVGKEVFAKPTQIFFGSGPNTFSREWGIHKPLSVNETQFWNTDFYYGVGFIPTSFVTTGVFGFFAWGAVCAALVWSLYRLFRASSANILRVTLVGSAIFLTTFHVLYIPGPALLLLAFLVFGALVAEEVATGAVREWTVSLSQSLWKARTFAALFVVSGIVVFAGSVQAVRAVVSDAFVNRAVVVYDTSQDSAKATRSISWAVAVSPQSDRAHRAGVELGLIQLTELSRAGDTSENARAALQKTLDAAIEHGLKAVSIEDHNYQNWLTLARLYGELAGGGVEGTENQARDAYAQARKNNPTSPLPYLGEAQLDLAKGNDAGARANLEAALTVKPNLAAAHFLLSQVYAQEGDFPKAREHAGAVVQIAPQDPLGWYNLGTVLYAESDHVNAVLAFQNAVGLQNDYSNALFLLGLSYYKLERREEALQAFKAVAAFNPQDKALSDMIAKLEAGKDLESPAK